MIITLRNISKKYIREWIIKDFSYRFETGKSYAITGNNGSGKSTLVQIIAGYLTPSSGEISFEENGTSISDENIYSLLSIAAPYLELIEDFTVEEQVDFHTAMKPMHVDKLLDESGLMNHLKKPIKNLSSGYKQRLKLALAFASQSPLLLLDEPTSNLDAEGVIWYHEKVREQKNCILVIASNVVSEYDFCDEILDVMKFKWGIRNGE